MRAIRIFTVITLAAMLCMLFSTGAAAALPPVGSIAGMVLSQNNHFIPSETRVTLINASNMSEEFTQFNTTVDSSGNFIFTQVPPGVYKAVALSPQHSVAMSSNITVSAGSTSSCSIVLIPKPIYCIVKPDYEYLPSWVSSTNILVTVYDWWNVTVPAGWYISMDASSGTLNPEHAITDAQGNVTTTLTRPQYGEPSAAITVHYRDELGMYHRLAQKAVPKPSVSPSPSPSPSVTPTPSVSPAPTPTLTPTPTPTPAPTPTPTPKATPGFEAIAAIGALGLIVLLRRK